MADFTARSTEAEKQWRRVLTVEDVAGLLRNDLEQTSCSLLPGLCDAKDTSSKKGRWVLS